MAITWRNVEAPSIGEASRAMYLGGMGINNGFDKLGEVLKQREATDTANWNQQATNNTEAFYNKIAQHYNTPEKYQAGLDSGEINGLMTANGAQIDQQGARRFMDQQMATLQGRAKAGIDYNNTMADSKDAPILDQVAALNAQGKVTEARALASSLIRNQGKAQQAISDTERSDTKFAQDNIKFGNVITKEARDAEMHPLDIGIKQANIRESDAGARLRDAQAQEVGVDTPEKAQRLLAKLHKEGVKPLWDEAEKTSMFKSADFNPNPTVHAANLTKTVDEYFGKDKESAATVNKYIQDNPVVDLKDGGRTVASLGYPKSVLMKVLNTTKNTGWFGDDYKGNFLENFKANLDVEMHKPEVGQEYANYSRLRESYMTGKPYGAGEPVAPKLPTPEPKDGTAVTNAPTTALDRVSPVTRNPVQNAPVTQAGADRKAFLKGMGGIADAVTLPGRAISDAVGMTVNAGSRIMNAVAGSDAVPKYQSSLGTYGLTPFYDMASNSGQPNQSIPTSVQPPVTKPKGYSGSITDGKGTEVGIEIMDGDTLRFKALDGKTKVPGAIGDVGRLANIDANETAKSGLGKSGQPLGEEALAFLKDAAEGKKVTVRVVDQAKRKDTDKTRNVIDMDIDGVPANLLLVKAGLARVSAMDTDTGDNLKELRAAENYARTNRIGVWGKDNRSVISASDFRKEMEKNR